MPEKKDATKLIENTQNKNNVKQKAALKGISQDLLNKVMAVPLIMTMPLKYKENIGTLSVQELFFQLIGLLGVRLGVSPVGMVELFVHGASLTT